MKRLLSPIMIILLLGSSSVVAKEAKRLGDYKKSHFNQYSINDEIKIGEYYMKQQIKAFEKKKIAVNPPQHEKLRTRLTTIVQRLAKVSDIPNLLYEVTIFDKQDVSNAYCLPGGKIGVYTGLFYNGEKSLISDKSDDEIAAVMAHEIAHATMRHATRSATTYNGVGLLGSLVSIGIGQGVGSDWGRTFNQIFQVGTSLTIPSYTRKHEAEADQVGFYYMAKAGFDPQAAINVWQRAAEKAKAKGKSDKTSFFASHPSSGSRAQALQAWYNDALEVQKLQVQQEKIKKKMRQ